MDFHYTYLYRWHNQIFFSVGHSYKGHQLRLRKIHTTKCFVHFAHKTDPKVYTQIEIRFFSLSKFFGGLENFLHGPWTTSAHPWLRLKITNVCAICPLTNSYSSLSHLSVIPILLLQKARVQLSKITLAMRQKKKQTYIFIFFPYVS